MVVAISIRAMALLVGLLLLGLVKTSAAQRSISPSNAVDKFYTQLLYLQIRGLPNDNQMKAISPFLAPRLRLLISKDGREQADFIKRHPDEKPPWIEGNLFGSLWEGINGFRPASAHIVNTTARVRVKCSYHDG